MNQGQIVILNGAPRSGKSSIAAAIQRTFAGDWINLGVDATMEALPEHLRPGIGLRPGGERPDLEPLIPGMYTDLYDSIAAHSRKGSPVVVDVGHHGGYATIPNPLFDCARRLAGLPVLFVGVRCDIEAIMERRNRGQPGRENLYERGIEIPAPVQRWQDAVHDPGLYDLEVDTTAQSPEACAEAILRHLKSFDPSHSVFRALAERRGPI